MDKQYVLDEKDRRDLLAIVKGRSWGPAVNFITQLKEFNDGRFEEFFKSIKTLAINSRDKMSIPLSEINILVEKCEKDAPKD